MTYPDDFNLFWKLWPGRWSDELSKRIKVGKRKALIQWQRISKTDREIIMNLMKTSRVKYAGTRYLQDAFRWLRDGGWEDFE